MNSDSYTEAEQEIVKSARKKALRLLEYQDRTRKMLLDRLIDEGFPEFAAEDAVQYAESFHYLDDARFAEIYVRNNSLRKSRFEMKGALREKGVPEDFIEEALLSCETDEESCVKELFLKKYASKDLSDPKTYEKAFRYFSGKGFSYETIRKALRGALSDSSPDPGEEV